MIAASIVSQASKVQVATDVDFAYTAIVDSPLQNNKGLCLRAAAHIHVTIFNTRGKFQPVSNFTELHALTLAAACSYALLLL